MKSREKMQRALRNRVIPILRRQGFKGSFPHFRRANEQNIDLLTFQFNRWGGSFVVELASCPPEGMTMSWGEKIPPNKVNAHHVNERYRLGANSFEAEGIWFDYETASSVEDYDEIAGKVLQHLKSSDSTWISSLFR